MRSKSVNPHYFFKTIVLVAVGLFYVNITCAEELEELKDCESCHTAQTSEFEASVHYINRSGVQASCNKCHQFQSHPAGKNTPKVVTKSRMDMAISEWTRMKGNDSRECKTCHTHMAMDLAKQEPRSVERHEESFADGETSCINCHKGISHHLPSGWKAKAQQAGLQN